MKKKKRVSIMVKLFAAVFAVYAAFVLVSLQFDINAQKSKKSELEELIETQKLRNAELDALINSENNDEYIADLARDALDYITPGERIFVDMSSK